MPLRGSPAYALRSLRPMMAKIPVYMVRPPSRIATPFQISERRTGLASASSTWHLSCHITQATGLAVLLGI